MSDVNTEPPLVRCGMCGGRAQVRKDPVYGRGARVIGCPKCAWVSIDSGRVDPAWYWRLRVWVGR